ncbi:MAG: hypothetical protein J6T41_06255, partial [Neisseriaceae bacterium]|nr:hypothetical protein [Neisseriaceae bacterium]
NTMIMPANIADVGGLVAAGMQIVKSQKQNQSGIRIDVD